MEDGVKEDTAKPKEAKFIGKEGWLKKSSGRFLVSYKDRYIQLEKTEVVVYENEDLKNCLERVDLENYDKCHELRSAFKKKNRLVLIRAPQCVNKVQDIKIQAQNPEEKDAWIKAFTDGISRAKNKIFDEVTVDESISLEHVTRTRPKGNQGRRPPTRIHMKEAANLSSDGILRMDLDEFDNTPNGTHLVNTEVDASKEAVKPPMPPSKLSESPQESPKVEPAPPKKILKPPMPPSKESKPSPPGEGEMPEEVERPTPTPPNKASDSSEELDNTQITASPSPTPIPIHPPMPPSKDKKPAQTVQWEIVLPSCAVKEGEEESPEEKFSDDQGKNDSDELGSVGDSAPPPATTAFKAPEAKLSSAVTEESDETSAEDSSVALEAEGNPAAAISLSADTPRPAVPLTKSAEPSPQPAKKNPGPPAPRKKKPLNRPEGNQPRDLKDISAEGPISAESKDTSPPNESLHSLVVSDPSEHKDGLTPTAEPKNKMAAPSNGDTADVTVLPDHHVQKRTQEESSDDDPQRGDGSGASPFSGREPVRDDGREAEAEPAEGHVSQEAKAVTGATSPAQMLQQVQTRQSNELNRPAKPRKPSMGKSASMGDLLSESAVPEREWALQEISRTSPRNDTNELHNKVALELEDTEELLDTLSSERETEGSLGAKGEPKDLSPEQLLTRAVEKLRKADHFLRVATSLKQANPLEKKHRISW
ncbi:pleckstrin homology domain-containing family O member 2 [Conger conger]|uniref:pleckstrin homology domain-containing family O member 2 n=1 Tax=Conger conger TaxID=82655 RepID=UPI002A599C5B|nr:pleckstrin homology domain-containing family O member 2 [Conger conger]